MKRKLYLIVVLVAFVLNVSSCKVSKEYVQYISKKENIVAPKTKKVIIFATDDVRVNEFKKTFEKNFDDKRDFVQRYLQEFSKKLSAAAIFSRVSINANNFEYSSVDKSNADYVIHFSNLEVTNRTELIQSGGMGMNGMGGMHNTTSSIEYCIINVKVEVYDAKNGKEILDFVAIGEASVFFLNFTKTLEKAKERSINHIINYLKSGKTVYDKY